MIHWKTFLAFEEQHDFFQLKEDDLYIWDILRFDIYLDYMWENLKERESGNKLLSQIVQSPKILLYLLLFLFRRSRPNLFFTNSRDKTADGHFYDKNADDFLKRLHPEAHILETDRVKGRKYLYPASLIKPASLFKKIVYLFYPKKDYTPLLEKINTGLGLAWDNKLINRHIRYFKSEKLFYSLLFRLKKTKRVYVTQNGLQKALFSAARERNIETIEFQHGIIDKGHIAYNYPSGITSGGPIYVPDLLLTFSEFWGHDINYPIKKIIPVGNTGFATPAAHDKKSSPYGKAIGFVSANVFGLQLAALAREYAMINTTDIILFKLHPNEFDREKEFVAAFRDFPNILVITNEHPVEDVILYCDAIVLIQSTIAYQALQAGIPLFIYKRMTYYRHAHIFNNPNVRLIDHARQIIITRQNNRSPAHVFFERFNESAYHSLSNFN